MTEIQAKIAKYLKILGKLDRPPSGPNWARFICEDPAHTAKAILRFAKGKPQFSYQPGYLGIKDRVELGIELETAVKIATTKGAPAGWTQNKELVEAFFDYDARRRYSALNPIGFDVEYFRVSRDVIIPVAPVSIIRERGRFVPIFVCGWTTNPLSLMQRRLLMTIYEDAFLSLTDYQTSPAEVLFFPKDEESEDRKRDAEVWMRGDYKLLSKHELDSCVDNFVAARELAREVLLADIERLRKQADAEKSRPSGEKDDRPDLFGKK